MLCVDADDRYSAEEVLNHPWVAVSLLDYDFFSARKIFNNKWHALHKLCKSTLTFENKKLRLFAQHRHSQTTFEQNPCFAP